MLGVVHVAPGTFFAIIAASALAATTAGGRGLAVPVVVIELLLGVTLGPYVLGLHVNQFIQFFADLGLGLLFFFAGYEIDMQRIMGQPLRLGPSPLACSCRSSSSSAAWDSTSKRCSQASRAS